MKAFVLGLICMLAISFAAAMIFETLDNSSSTTYTSKNNSVRLSIDEKTN